jgi:type I restriction enzyme S subunit
VIDTSGRVADRAEASYAALLGDIFDTAVARGCRPLGTLATTRLGKMLDEKRAGDRQRFLYLGNADVQWDKLRTHDVRSVPLTASERQALSLAVGDVLICEGGEIGRAAVVMDELPDVYYQKAIHRVRCGPALRPRFLMHFMRFAAITGYLNDYTTSTTIAHLTGEKLRLLPVPTPSVAEQDRAIELLDAASDLARAGRTVIDRARSLRSALCHDLLVGLHEIPPSYDRLLAGAP